MEKLKNKFYRGTLGLTAVVLILLFINVTSHAKVPSEKFQSGDIIFQTSTSDQSFSIIWATKSLYSHVGIIENRNNKLNVIEAISVVSETPIEEWINRGQFKRYAVIDIKI